MNRVALVGSGISSCAAAWQLSRHVDVTIFERSAFRGGHGYTAEVDVDGEARNIDIGVQIIRPDLSPTTYALLKSDPAFAHLRLRMVQTGLISRTRREGRDFHYTNVKGLHDDPRFAEDWARFGPECVRFQRLVANVDAQTKRQQTIGVWLQEHNFSEDFVEAVLIPSMSVVTVTRSGLLDGLFVTSLHEPSALLSLTEPGLWYRFGQGVESFRAVLLKGLESRFVLDAQVVRCTSERDGRVTLTIERKGKHLEEQTFDAVVWGADLPAAWSALDHDKNPHRATHGSLLPRFETEPAWIYVHRDSSWVPQGIPHTSAALFSSHDGLRQMHYNVNQLRNENKDEDPIWISLCNDSLDTPPAPLLLPPIRWVHPRSNPAIFAAQRSLQDLQGLGGIWFCGAGTVLAGFEACLLSGLNVAQRLHPDISFPFAQPSTPLQQKALQTNNDLIQTWMFPTEP